MKLVNAKDMIAKAYANKYAIAHINTNNLEWTKAILMAAQENNAPIIIGVSEGACTYMGGYKTVADMTKDLMINLKITVPVALHLDHGTYEGALAACDAGFSSVMFDGHKLSIEDNLVKTAKVVAKASKLNISVEAEIGSIGGEEDGVIGNGEIADPKDAIAITKLGIDFLAAGIGNIHGPYPANWTGLHLDRLKEIAEVSNMGIVLHGGSGIPDAQVKESISLGVAKVNVNTECQLAFAAATRKYFENNHDKDDKGYDPRKVLKPGVEAIKATIKEKLTLFGSINKA